MVLFLPFFPFDTLGCFPGGRTGTVQAPERRTKTGPGENSAVRGPYGRNKAPAARKNAPRGQSPSLSFCLRDWRSFGKDRVAPSAPEWSSFSRVTSTHSPRPRAGRLRVLLLRQAGFPFSAVFLRASFVLFSCPEYGNTVGDTCQPPMDILMDLSSAAGFPFSAAPWGRHSRGGAHGPSPPAGPVFRPVGAHRRKIQKLSPSKVYNLLFFLPKGYGILNWSCHRASEFCIIIGGVPSERPIEV